MFLPPIFLHVFPANFMPIAELPLEPAAQQILVLAKISRPATHRTTTNRGFPMQRNIPPGSFVQADCRTSCMTEPGPELYLYGIAGGETRPRL
jgi:hypothetical protein